MMKGGRINKGNGGTAMKKRRSINKKMVLWLQMAFLIAAVLMMQAPAQAACDVTPDADCDGLTDTEETAGITTCNGIPVPGCSGQTCPATNLMPGQKDLFVIVTPDNTNSSAYRLAIIPNRMEFATVVRAHEITREQAGCKINVDRSVTTNQKAARIVELLDTSNTTGSDDALGWTDAVGAANGSIPYGDGYIYTERIANWVSLKCGSGTCKTSDNQATTKVTVIPRYIKHTLAHEVGHMLNLKQVPESKIGNHYPVSTTTGATRYTLDQYVYFKSGIFYMGTQFNPNDPSYAKPR
jgi:hypothetical protein